ncbi:MAG: hypothetical protein JXA93_01045 [Anaerolineae bacterium]|nr:hypothetical protein [Anaerolineae bacterium]
MKNVARYLPLVALVLIVTALLLASEGVAARPSAPQASIEPTNRTTDPGDASAGIESPGATLFSYQGQLLDAQDVPVHGYVGMTFALYDVPAGGTAFWTETYTGTQAISVTNGIFHVLLGSLVPIDPAGLTADAYLQLTVTNEALSPRELLTSVAYAIEAGTLSDGDLAVVGDISSTGEIYEEHKTIAYTDDMPRWFRFAQSPVNVSHNSGVFEIRWQRQGYHGHVRFAVGADYGYDAAMGITVLDSSSFGTAVTAIRLLMHESDDQMYIEAYDQTGGAAATPLTIEVYKHSGWGWSLIDITPGSVPAGYTSYEMPTTLVFGARSDANDILILDRNGRVGIGTTQPEATLSLGNNTLLLRGSGNVSEIESDLFFDGAGGLAAESNLLFFIDADNNQDDDTAIYFLKNAETSGDANAMALMTVKETGSVGIGTTDPFAEIHVKQGSAGYTSAYQNTGLFIENSAPSILQIGSPVSQWGAVYFGDAATPGAGQVLYSNSTDDMGLYTQGTEKVRITSNGRVGIGTTAPTHKLHVAGSMRLEGSCEAGAYIESNLQTEEERDAETVERFKEGDILCWGIDRLEICSVANDRLVQAVADAQGRPIVLGAEVIKVIGPVRRGDILVASDVPGYAMVNNDPVSGSVIAQALEDFEGERGLIKAMIRKW